MSARPDIGATSPAGAGREGRPVVARPVWTPEVPLYFHVGGLAGASAVLALLSEAAGERGVARRAWVTASAASLASPALLISDLGVPSRFLNMLRMFKITSPMSVGSWVLAGFGAATVPATAQALTGRLGAPGRLAQLASAALGLPLATYTAALVANTSVPAWREARRELPFVFAAGAATSAGALATALAPLDEAAGARRLAAGAGLAELLAGRLMEQRLDRAGVGAPYHGGPAARLARASNALSAAGVALLAGAGRRSRPAAVSGGTLLLAGSLAQRWAIFRAGARSAERPSDTVGPQRARVDAGEARGAERRRARGGQP